MGPNKGAKLAPDTVAAAKNLDGVLGNLAKNFATGTNYFQKTIIYIFIVYNDFINKVEKVIVHNSIGGSSIFGFNREKPFITKEHPILTKKGWKSISPIDAQKARPYIKELLNDKIQIGDNIITESKELILQSIEEYKIEDSIKLYDLSVSGNNTFLVNGIFVHNKKIPVYNDTPPPKPNKGDIFTHNAPVAAG